MNYTYCNNEEVQVMNKIIILPSLTYADLYESNRINLQTSDLAAGECRSVLQYGEVDTCTRGRVNAQMKIEGWKGASETSGNYCHLYRHYFPKIVKYTNIPTAVPSEIPTVSPSSGTSAMPTEKKLTEFPSQQLSEVPTTTFSNVPSKTFSTQPTSTKTTTPSTNPTFSNIPSKTISTQPTSTKTTIPSTNPTSTPSFDDPLGLEFKWILNPSVKCTIIETGQTCEDYILTISALTPDNCNIDVEYEYEVSNIGTKCDLIVSVISMVNEQRVTNIPMNHWTFCPGDVTILKEQRNENICDFAGEEVDFKIILNEIAGCPGETFIGFPDPNVVSCPPTPT